MNPFKSPPKKKAPEVAKKVADSPAFDGDARPGGAEEASAPKLYATCHHNFHPTPSGHGKQVCFHCGEAKP